jgi:hypothetical protein
VADETKATSASIARGSWLPLSPFIIRSLISESETFHLSHKLNNTTGLLDLALSLLREVTGTDNDWDLGETTLAEDFGVAEREEVENGGGVGLLA